LVQERDDATIEWCALLNQTGQPARAAAILAARRFQPWEGGEGQALGQHVRTHLALGRAALRAGDAAAAATEFTTALEAPDNLGEARHLLANASDIFYWLGEAQAAGGREAEARSWWRRAAEARGDFQEMSVRAFSEMTYFSARSLEKLGESAAAKKLFRALRAHADRLARTRAQIDYFATSLPTMLLFDDDLDRRQQTTALFLRAQADAGLGRTAAARQQLRGVLRRDPSHGAAADLLAEL
jgi:tetratricopeptide (TPR) repeat protein